MGEKLVAERFVVKKLVVVADVEVELSAVKFCRVEDALERKPPVKVESPATASEPVKLAAEEIV